MSTNNHISKEMILWYLGAAAVFWTGAMIACWKYPGGYDWQYTVVSSLASHKRNPDGGFWFAGSLVVSILLLWPCLNLIRRRLVLIVPEKKGYMAIWTGSLFTVLVGMERLLVTDMSSVIHKSHEIMALAAFLPLYVGILILMVQLTNKHMIHPLLVVIIAVPLLSIFISQLWLYPEQRELGWGKPHWRQLGISYWVSFPFWQWLAMLFLWIGMAVIVAVSASTRPAR